jgi:hypothetical protein
VRVSAGGPPWGVVTFLFTDIEGSTRRWESDADAMRSAVVAHEKVLRTAIEARFLFSRTGDGVVAAFASPKAAVDAVIDAQRELQLPVRMGLATGESELRDGNYLGTVLNRAARVMAAGHGGQVLLADSTTVLLTGVDQIDLGPRRLRDVSVPVGGFQVRAQGVAERAAAALVPHRKDVFAQEQRAAAWERIPLTYVVCGLDNAIPPAAQEHRSSHAGTVSHLEASHSPVLSRPHDVTAIIQEALAVVVAEAGA